MQENKQPDTTTATRNIVPFNRWIILLLSIVILNVISYVQKFTLDITLFVQGSSSPTYSLSMALNMTILLLLFAVLWLLFTRKKAAIHITVGYLIVQLIFAILSLLNPYAILMLFSLFAAGDPEIQLRLLPILLVPLNIAASIGFLLYFKKSTYVSETFNK